MKVSERVRLRLKAEAFDLFNHPNFQQSVVDNLQYFIAQRTDAGGNPLPIWDVDTSQGNNGKNDHFGKPGAIAPKYGSRNFQFSARISF